MNNRAWWLAAAAFLGVPMFWLQQESPAPAAAQPQARIAESTAARTAPETVATLRPAAAASAPALPFIASPPTAIEAPLPAADTMAHARQHGDDRTPPIDAPDPAEALQQPTHWDLSDPARYRDYELRQQQRVQIEYLRASDHALPKWRAALAEAVVRGTPAEDVRAAEEKIRRLESAQSALLNGPAPVKR